MLAAEAAIREWVNADPGLVPQNGDPDSGAPICRGAYLRTQRSPADGAYLVISRALPGGNEAGVAEVTPALGLARITAQAYAGTEEAAEEAAAAYARAVAACTGVPRAVRHVRGVDPLTRPARRAGVHRGRPQLR